MTPPKGLRLALLLVSALYLAWLFFDAVGIKQPASLEPRPLRFFTQAACLFPRAAEFAIDYRAEVYRCRDATWIELDTRPYFPIDADNKENRFFRVMHFFRKNRPTMRALDDWLVGRLNAEVAGRAMDQDGEKTPVGDKTKDWIGGVRFSSLRIPIPRPGEPVSRWDPRPLDHYPEDQVKRWYHTSERSALERCARYLEPKP